MKTAIKWEYHKPSKFWTIEDKFGGYAYGTKPKFPKIRFCGQWMILFPVTCEWTGKQIGWRSTVQKDWGDDVFPAFFSFKVIDRNGKVKKV